VKQGHGDEAGAWEQAFDFDMGACACARRFNAVIAPVTAFICECLPEGARESKPGELAYEDLDKLQPEEIMRACEWLTDKARSFWECFWTVIYDTSSLSAPTLSPVMQGAGGDREECMQS
jgi:hypothetical protein